VERSAWTVRQPKFSRLPSAAQHRLLARLARETMESLKTRGTGDTDAHQTFLLRYDQLHAWTELDRYNPPSWLEPFEALEEFQNFHQLFGAPAESEGPLVNGQTPVSWEPHHPVEVALDQVRSPYNVGSVLRLVDNFGLRGLVHASPWLRLDHPRLRRAARGCERWVPVRCEEDLPDYLRRSNCPVVGVENQGSGTSLQNWRPPTEAVLVLGNETYGLAKAVRHCCSEMVFVPMQGYKRSMNVHHALALVAWRMVGGRAGGDGSGGSDTQGVEDIG